MLKAALFVGGLVWCKEVFGRFRTDLARLKKGDSAEKGAIVFFWALTVGVLFLMVHFAIGVISGFASAF